MSLSTAEETALRFHFTNKDVQRSGDLMISQSRGIDPQFAK
jgi:hypothetical protein